MDLGHPANRKRRYSVFILEPFGKIDESLPSFADFFFKAVCGTPNMHLAATPEAMHNQQLERLSMSNTHYANIEANLELAVRQGTLDGRWLFGL